MKNIWFVSHPHVEPTVLASEICPWNISGRHKRKLIESLESQYLKSVNGPIYTDTIYFAGEWECCSFYRKNTLRSSFKHIHKPIFTELDSSPKVINTDPFVLGKKFYYVCCGIKKEMKPGDMVVFGKSTGPNNTTLIVDTVLIIEGIVNRFENQQVFFPSGYNEVTLSKMHLSDLVIVGQMYEDVKEENLKLFSFVPCRLDSAFKCPEIQIQYGGKYLHGGSGANHLKVDEKDFAKIYNKMITDILSQDCYLGIHMPMPEFNPIAGSKHPEDYNYYEYYGKDAHKTTPLENLMK